MSTSAEHRRLAAIMFTDMVGYSALVERNEARALQLLEEHRQLLRSIFPKHEGSEIKTIGDGFMVEFSSALAAVRCGVEIQEAIVRRNSANPSQGNFHLRIGIHAGDVVRRADDVIGDGVNIAARIVPLAGADGICVSRQVFDQIENRLANPLKIMGQVKVKNMIRPLEVYWVGYEGAPSNPPDLVQTDKLSSAQKSIAVLPFVNMSSDPENEYLSDGLTEDLIMAFSRLKGLRVPARTSSFAFKGKNEDVRRIGQQLNVTKLLEGSVRKVGNRLRITAQLINTTDGDHLWSQTFDREIQEVFAIQDEITHEIVDALEMQLVGAGDQSVTKHGTYNTEAYQLYLQARYHYYKFTGEGFRRCIECCKKALRVEPNYALAYAALSLSYQLGWHYGHLSLEEKLATDVRRDLAAEKAATLDPNLAEAQTDDLLIKALSKPLSMVRFWNRAAEKAVELDPNLAEAQTVLAMVRFWNERDWRAAEDCFKRAIKLNPNYVTAHEHYAGALICMRRDDDAITHARLAQQLDPLSPMIIMHAGFVYWLNHRYDLLLEQARTLLDLQSNFFGGYWASGLAHWGQGKREAAVAELRKAITLGGGPMPLADLGCLLGRLNRKAEAQRVLEDLGELGRRVNVQPTYLGFVHASLGNYDEAFACFSQGLEQQNASVMWLREYCSFAGLDELRADSRFPALLKKIGLEGTNRVEATSPGNAGTIVKEELDNSATDVNKSLKKCPRCGVPIRNNERTCINCLLHEGLKAKGEASRETFESILVEATVADTHWRLGHYEILEEIGRGGMGVIYRARQRHSRRIVAVKRVLAHQVNSHETLVRFRREAEAVASLDHPNILPIHEVSESEEGLPFFSMKYATGGSLRTAAPTLRTEPRKCVQLMAKIARAIDYAHGKGILHRDLQPGNILLDENGEPLVSDFGLAKWFDQGSDLTRTLETLGTPGYIAPEQAERPADKLTCAADVYSLGAILFYLLTGRPPFVGTNVLHVIHQAAATPAPRLRSLAPSLDRDLETIVARCLEADPNARYQSAGALADDLEHWLRHEPIRARRTGLFTRSIKWVRRNPTTTVLVAALVSLAASIVGVTVWKSESPNPIRPLPTGVAVLPFENLSADPEDASFTDGMQDEILNDLTKVADLKVISRTSVMQYKSGTKRNLRQIANELGVTHVVEGSVQRAANRVRVSAQLIDAKTDTHLWAERYDRPLDDVFGIQSEIAKAIAGQLQAKLSPAEKAAIEQPPTTNLVAYDRYLRAQKLRAVPTARVPGDMREIIRLLNQAIAHDPTFLRAYGALASAHAYVYHLGVDHTPARIALAKQARDTALRLGPDRPEAHLAAAWVAYHCYRDYETALTEAGIARRGLPNDASVIALSAYIARRQGHWEECTRNLERAAELDPRNVWLLNDVAQTYQMERRFSDATVAWDRVLGVAPGDPTMRVARTLLDLEARADSQPAYEAIQRVVAEDPSAVDMIPEQWLYVALCGRDAAEMASALASLPPEGIIPWNVRMPRSFFEGLVARVRNDATGAETAFTAARLEMEKIVREQPDYGQAFCVLGMIDAALGRREDAIREGRRAVELLPVTKDALAGAAVLTNLAITYAWTGEKDLAIKQLEDVVRIPSPACYGQLKLHPFWDPLRGDPRFEKLVEEARKPVALESSRPLPAGIALLPFENLSTDPENAFFTDGVQDEILNNLAKIADLKVISRTSVMQYKPGANRNLRQIANELGVAHVVEGSVQRVATRVRVSAQLIDTRTDTLLWVESYDRPLDNVFAIQSEIAQAIAAQLQAKLSPKEKAAIEQLPTSDLVAYDLYLKAKELIYNGRFNPGHWERGVFKAVQLLDEAVTRDPAFLLAHCQLARANDQIYFANWDHTETRLALAQSSVEAAVRLQPDSGETHLAQANHFFKGYLNYDRAREELAKAQRALPNNTEVFRLLGGMCRWQGRWKEATQNLQRAVELDPRNTSTLTDLAWVYIALRKYEEADAIASRLQMLEPRSHILRCGRAWIGLWARADAASLRAVLNTIEAEGSQSAAEVADLSFQVAVYERDQSAAARALGSMPHEGRIDMNGVPFPYTWYEGLLAKLRQNAAAAHSAFTSARAETEKLMHAQPGNVKPLAVLALIDAELGDKQKAIRQARTACDMLPPTKDALDGVWLMTNLARIYALTGENDLALQQLEVLSKLPSSWFGISYGDLRLNPEWDSVRGNPRFEKLLQESKIPVALK